MKFINLQRDVDYIGSGYSDTYKSTDKESSKKLLLDSIMKKCNISEEDLDDINIVKSKMREVNISDILDEKPFWKRLF
jgi:hypothetical protein